MIKLRKYLPLLIVASLLGCASSPERKRAAQDCHRTGHSGLIAHMNCMERWEKSQKNESYKSKCQSYGFRIGTELAQCIQREIALEKSKKDYQDKLSNAAISSAICSALAKDSASCIAGSLEGSAGVSQNLEKERIEKMEKEIKKLKEEKDDLERKKFRESLDKPRRY